MKTECAAQQTYLATVKGNKDESNYLHPAKNLAKILLLTLFRPSADGLDLSAGERKDRDRGRKSERVMKTEGKQIHWICVDLYV